jgi:hypothetical protein
MHALLFPFRVSLAGPLHAFFCVMAWPALRGFACMAYADPDLSAGATLLCERLQGLMHAALSLAGNPLATPSSACSARPLELLAAAACALSCLVTVRRAGGPLAQLLARRPPASSRPPGPASPAAPTEAWRAASASGLDLAPSYPRPPRGPHPPPVQPPAPRRASPAHRRCCCCMSGSTPTSWRSCGALCPTRALGAWGTSRPSGASRPSRRCRSRALRWARRRRGGRRPTSAAQHDGRRAGLAAAGDGRRCAALLVWRRLPQKLACPPAARAARSSGGSRTRLPAPACASARLQPS